MKKYKFSACIKENEEEGVFKKLPRSYRRFVIVLLSVWLATCLLILSMTMNGATRVSAVEANGVGVYWDSDCSDKVSLIDWGTLNPGSVKNVAVYISNEGEKTMYLIISTTNWNPSKASQYLYLAWNYSAQQINPGENLQITLTLSVSRYIAGISSFSFDILITGREGLLGDIDGNGKVDGYDLLGLGMSWGARPGDDNWNPNADFDGNNKIDGYDLMTLTRKLLLT